MKSKNANFCMHEVFVEGQVTFRSVMAQFNFFLMVLCCLIQVFFFS